MSTWYSFTNPPIEATSETPSAEVKEYFTEYLATTSLENVKFEDANISIGLSGSITGYKFVVKGFIDKLVDKVEILETYPNMGRVVPEFENQKIRELIEGNYRIVYRTSSDRVEIIRVHHSSRNLKI